MMQEKLIRDDTSGALLNARDDYYRHQAAAYKLINSLQKQISELYELVDRLSIEIEILKGNKKEN